MSQDDDSRQDPQDPQDPKAELFEAIDHFKNAASLLFERATKDPAVKTATEEAGRMVRKIGEGAEPLARQLGDELSKLSEGAEPLARQLGGELSRLTRQITDAVNQNLGKRAGAAQETPRESGDSRDDD